jgi:FAD/FMN-containing dehydrogenase
MRRRNLITTGLTLAAGSSLGLSPLGWATASASAIADVDAVSLSGRQLTLTGAQLGELRAALRGSLLLPGGPGYDSARHVLNAAIDKHPALIVQPTGVADVSAAVQFARDNQLVIAVKCGGHSTSGQSTVNGGMMIDLSQFRHVRVDADARRARVSGGSLLGALDHESMAHGLVTTAGTVSHTGVGGLTTGGGFGRLARRFGLSLDNVTAVDVVSADGQARYCTEDLNEDLYWGVRGAGSNFGVVTSFEFELHPMERSVIAGNLVYPIERLRDVLEFYGEHAPRWPDELYADLVFGYPGQGKPGFIVLAPCYSGDKKQAEAVLAVFDRLGKPMAGELRSWDYVELQRSGDSTLPRATASYLKGGFISTLPPKLVDDIIDGLEPAPDRSTQFIFQQAGGAIKRIPAAATAFAHRYAELNMILTLDWQPGTPGDAHMANARAYWKTLAPHTHGFYVNEADEENAALHNRNYQGNFQRLVEIKRRYDPDNNFRLNANIRVPA